MSESVSYDIHEKIAQLETELLQHELLIRRQKHVITSLKNMINNPANQGLIGSPSATHVPVSTTAPVYVAASNPSTARKTISLPIRTTSAVVAAAPQTNLSVSSSSAKKSSSSTDVTINLEKKRTAIDMVKQFCKTVPKFGTEVVKKKRASVSGGGEGAVEGGASKRLRAGDLLPGTYAAALPSPVVGAGAATTAQAALRPQSASSSSSSSSRQSSTVVLGSNMTAADDDAFFATADAKLRYLSSTASRVAGGTNAASARPSSAMQPISLMPLASSAAAWAATNPNVNTNAASAKSSSKRTASGAAGVVASQPANSSSGLSNNSSGSSKAVSSAVASSKSNTTTVRAGAVVGSNTPLTVGSTASSSSIANSKAPPSTAVATTKKAAKAAATLAAAEAKALFQKHSVSAAISTESSTPIRATTMSAVARSGAAPPATPTPVIITVNKNLLTGSAYKNLDVFDHCKNVRTLEEKLEISKDMHAYIICNPRRLQQFLDSTGGRDLFLSWLISAMAALSEMEHTTTNNNSTSATAAGGSVGGSQQQEVQLTKLIEYTVLLINQAYWDARSVSELRFDKTLKSLYRQFEHKKEAHHVTVSNIVKGIWPSYRIMRKQHEGRSRASAVLVAD